MNDRGFLFAVLAGEPYLHGIAGNMSVMAQLCEKEYDNSMYICEKKFQEKHPEYKNDFNSWLWIIYKDLNNKNIDDTIKYLDELCGITKCNDELVVLAQTNNIIRVPSGMSFPSIDPFDM